MVRAVGTPVRWLGRAVRGSGAERVAFVQAVKAALAAVLAWLAGRAGYWWTAWSRRFWE